MSRRRFPHGRILIVVETDSQRIYRLAGRKGMEVSDLACLGLLRMNAVDIPDHQVEKMLPDGFLE
ncbi:MAG: hypothetical protein PVH30_05175 [Desulfobacterales bacterium]|jgi:hypothetical protein